MLGEVFFGNLVQVRITWPDFKHTVASKNLRAQHVESDGKHMIFAVDSQIVYVTQIYTEVSPDRRYDIISNLIDSFTIR